MATITIDRRRSEDEPSHVRRGIFCSIEDVEIVSLEHSTDLLVGIIPVIGSKDIARVNAAVAPYYFVTEDGQLLNVWQDDDLDDKAQAEEDEYYPNSRIRNRWGCVCVLLIEGEDNPDVDWQVWTGTNIETWTSGFRVKYLTYHGRDGLARDHYGEKSDEKHRRKFFTTYRENRFNADRAVNYHPGRTKTPIATSFGAINTRLKTAKVRRAAVSVADVGGRCWDFGDADGTLPASMFDSGMVGSDVLEPRLIHLGLDQSLSRYRTFVPSPGLPKADIEDMSCKKYPAWFPGNRVFISRADGLWRFVFVAEAIWAAYDGSQGYNSLAYMVPILVTEKEVKANRKVSFRGLPIAQQQAIWEVKGMAQAMTRAMNAYKGEMLSAPDLGKLPSDKAAFPKHHSVVSWNAPYLVTNFRDSRRRRYGAQDAPKEPKTVGSTVALLYRKVSPNEIKAAEFEARVIPVAPTKVRALDL